MLTVPIKAICFVCCTRFINRARVCVPARSHNCQTVTMFINTQAMDNCVSEVLIRQVADAIVRLGLKTLGYQYINLDDCVRAFVTFPRKLAIFLMCRTEHRCLSCELTYVHGRR